MTEWAFAPISGAWDIYDMGYEIPNVEYGTLWILEIKGGI